MEWHVITTIEQQWKQYAAERVGASSIA
jgi:hypothetical protein